MKRSIRSKYLVGLCLLTACSLLEDATDTLDVASEIVGEYEVVYLQSGNEISAGSLLIERLSENEVTVSLEDALDRPSFTAEVFLTTTDNYGLQIADQSNGGFDIVGLPFANSDFNGAYIVEDSALTLAVLYEGPVTDSLTILDRVTAEEELGGLLDLIFNDSIFDPMDNIPPDSVEDPVDEVAFEADTIFTTDDDVWAFGFYSEDIGAVYSENAVSRSIHITTDGGQSWATKSAPDNSRVRDIEFSTAMIVFAASDNGVYRSEDQGDSWVSLSNATGATDITLFESSAFVMESQFSVDGLNWEQYTIDGNAIDSWQSGTLDAATFLNGDVALAFFRDVGNGNMFFGQSSNGGAAWTLKSQPLNRSVRSISFINEDTGFAVGEFDGLVRTDDGGTTWEIADDGQDAYFVHVDGDFGFALFSAATYSIDGGDTWQPIMDSANDIPVNWPVGSGASGQGMGSVVFVTDGANGGNVVKFDLDQFEDN